VGQVMEVFHSRSDQELEECRIDLMELASPSSSLNLTVGSLGVGRDQEIGQIGLVGLAETRTRTQAKPLVVLRLILVGLSPSHSKCHGVVELHRRCHHTNFLLTRVKIEKKKNMKYIAHHRSPLNPSESQSQTHLSGTFRCYYLFPMSP
jgi:hypothetical protein